MKRIPLILLALFIGVSTLMAAEPEPVDVGLIEQRVDGFYYLNKAKEPFEGVGVAYHEVSKDVRYRIREEWYAKGKLDEEKTEKKQVALLKQAEAKLGPDNPVTVLIRKYLADYYFQVGLFIKAAPIYEKLLQESEQRKVELNNFLVSMQVNLSKIKLTFGEFKNSEKLCFSVLEFKKENNDILGMINAYAELAGVFLEQEKFEIARKYIDQLHAFSKNNNSHSKLAQMRYHNVMGYYFEWIGDTAKARQHYQKSLLLSKELNDTSKSFMAYNLRGIGYSYLWDGEDLELASRYLNEALGIIQKYYGKDHLDLADIRTWLGWAELDLGNIELSIELLIESDRAQITSLGGKGYTRIWTLYYLGWAKHSLGEYEKSLKYFRLSKRIAENIFGMWGSNYGFPAYGEAFALMNTGKYEQAKNIGLHLRQIILKNDDIRQSLGPTAEWVLARSYSSLREYEKSFEIYKSLVSKSDDNAVWLKPVVQEYSLVLFKLGRKEEAVKKLEELVGNLKVTDPILTQLEIKSNLALLHMVKGGDNNLVNRINVIQRMQTEAIESLFKFTSEHGRMALMKNNNPFDLPCNLGDVGLAHEALFRYKGLVLDSIVEDRRVRSQIKDPNLLQDIKRLQNLKRLEASPMNQIEEGKDRATYIKSLEDTVGGQLAKISAKYIQSRRAFTLKPAQVAERLGKGEVLLDYIRYDKYLDIDKTEPHYGVVLLAKGIKPRWITLGKAEEIEKLVSQYNPFGQASDEDYEEVLFKLYKKLIEPAVKKLPAGTDRMIICPDGQLNFLNFGTLLNEEDGFVCEDYLIRYVASERDLLQEGKRGVPGKGLVVFANPAFGEEFAQADAPLVAMRAVEMNDLRAGVNLVPLPGTQKEADFLKEKAGGWKLSGEFYVGSQADEKQLSAVRSPRVLHLATHGFFLPESRGQKGLVKNPMHRSGLALAGAQKTLEMWGKGKAPPASNDGILTAAEVGMLDLKGTWLVVLSACETGRGEARSGEGVMGLRRGFIQAGTQNLLMTLWPVSDKQTIPFMKEFYEKAIAGGDAPTALAKTQTERLVKLRDIVGTKLAVQLYGPFIMSFQGAE